MSPAAIASLMRAISSLASLPVKTLLPRAHTFLEEAAEAVPRLLQHADEVRPGGTEEADHLDPSHLNASPGVVEEPGQAVRAEEGGYQLFFLFFRMKPRTSRQSTTSRTTLLLRAY